MKNRLFVLLPFAFAIGIANAQTEKRSIALMPFTAIAKEHKSIAPQVQDLVAKALATKDNIVLIDRTNDSLLIHELDRQLSEMSATAGGLAEQGKLSGAKEMIKGAITRLIVTGTSTNASLSANGSGETQYSAKIGFSLQLIDIATGIVKEHIIIDGTTKKSEIGNSLLRSTLGALSNTLIAKDKSLEAGKLTEIGGILLSKTPLEAVKIAIQACEKDLMKWVNSVFQPEIKLVVIKDRSGSTPETVLVTGLDESCSKKTRIIVNEVTLIPVNGEQKRWDVKIAELQVLTIQGDLTLCKIKDGGAALEEKMNNGTLLELVKK